MSDSEESEEEFFNSVRESFSDLSDAVKNRLEKMQMFHRYSQAMMRDDLPGMLYALDFPIDLIETMTYPEVLESLAVRVADLAKEVGFKLYDN